MKATYSILLIWVMLTGAEAAYSAGNDPKYTGPGSCSSATCHGSIRPRTDNDVLQNEYSTWAVLDKHSRAASALTNETGKRIGRILGIDPETSAKCLDCHALNAPATARAKTFDKSEGVSCESCHGPASEWLGPHTTRGWTHEQSLRLGMSDLRNPMKRTETCLTCHLGTATKFVDHEMLAAGHPDLYFEIDSFSAAMPAHWKERDTDPWFEVRLMVVGQAIQFKQQMLRISRETARSWPEFSELDCFSCHHELTGTKTSWRQERGYPGRRAGNPPWNASRYSVLKLMLDETSPEDAHRLDSASRRVNSLVSSIMSDRQEIAAAADSAAKVADQIACKFSTYHFDPRLAFALMKRISGAGDWLGAQGERSAEQATMVLNSMMLIYCHNTKPGAQAEGQMKTAVAALFHELESPSQFTPAAFRERMRAFARLLPDTR